ncbi:signal peptidase I [Nocardioides nitrophenolicus]|uniref:signal peptidase I n=1 Tax=Nocardioides nitrophenolicus TaxID=60489 RepID=UPI00195C29C0|nr:signal peptidase I [Nocardioides nitrophenolicus]MBM7516748.1 signal peptidase I [Nocardioides nitrophenolicus]
MTHRADSRPWLRTVLGLTALVVFFAVMLVVIAALAFSVKVSGSSMEPTLSTGDRLLVDPFGKGTIHRFDIVESTLGDREIPVVKRVIGLPGDRIKVRADQDPPVVLLRPAGEDATYAVDNPTWAGRVGAKVQACCAEDGTALPGGGGPAWVTVPAGSYWVVGDNWGGSDDSRTFGFVRSAQVRARIVFRLQPLGELGGLPDQARLVPVDG